jgi:hypothetical protein
MSRLGSIADREKKTATIFGQDQGPSRHEEADLLTVVRNEHASTFTTWTEKA